MIIKINPLDTLFFKDGKPFSMGIESWADGIFPPTPSVFYGALRSAYFADNINEFAEAGTDKDPTNNLIIKGIYYLINDEYYFPLPFDLAEKKGENKNKVYLLKRTPVRFISNSKLPETFEASSSDRKVETVEDGIIRESSFSKYLKNEEESYSIYKLSDFILSEPKIGIGRENSTRTSLNGKLYRVGMRRLENEKKQKINFIVEFDNLELKDNGYLKLGGEGKIVYYEKIDGHDKFKEININNDIIKLVLLSPAFFKTGWYPDLNTHKIFNDFSFELIAAAVGKQINIGGFDMKSKRPKPMRKAVPAGSVYYYKIKSINNNLTFKNLKLSISDFLANEGYGLYTLGEAK